MSATDLLFLNQTAADWTFTSAKPSPASEVLAFHQRLPDYNVTPLRTLPELAEELGLGHVLLKDESSRCGLPAFKITGASWAVYRAIAARLGLPESYTEPSVADLGAKARKANLRIVTCTEGNCGRAISRMGKYMGVPVKVFVPQLMSEETRALIRSEDAEVVVVDGNYDDSVIAAREESANPGMVLVLDVGLDGYEDVPQVR